MTLRVHPDEIVAESSDPLLGVHSSWCRVPVKAIAQIVNGAPFSSDLFNQSGDGVPLIRIRDVGRNEPATYYSGEVPGDAWIEPGAILIGMDGDFRIARWGGPAGALNQRVCRIVLLDPAHYSEAFLLYAMQGYLDAIAARTSSVTVKHLSSRTIGDIPLPLPPLPEQHRIVEAIEEQFSRLDVGVASLQRAKRNLARMRESAVHALMGEPAWPQTALGEIAEVVGGVTKNQRRENGPGMVEVPYLRVANVQRGYLDLAEIKMIRVEPERAEVLRLLPGDILLNEGGDRDKLGRGWVWEGQIEGCIHQNHVYRARLHSDMNPRFVSTYANVFGRQWFERMGSQTTNLASISRTALRQFPVPSPSREEQDRVVAELDRQFSILGSMQAAIDAGLARAERLRQSILREAFAGRLVPQNPADGPASSLLERIQAERTKK